MGIADEGANDRSPACVTSLALRADPVQFQLRQNVDGDVVLIHSSPQIILDAIDLEEDLVPMSLRTNAWTFLLELRGIEGAKLPAQFPNCLILHLDTPYCHHFFDVAIDQEKAEVRPNAVLYHFNRKTMTMILLRAVHRLSFSYP